MQDIAGWIAPIATAIAAMMTASNLGSRVTGWGFVVFVVGSISWSIVGIVSGQANLVATNAFLTLVNVLGVWRWLGRQAKYEEGGTRAAERSAASHSETLFSTAALAGSQVIGPDDVAVGTIVDAMAACDGAHLAYVVLSEGGVGGVGERLHAVEPKRLRFAQDRITTDLTLRELKVMPALEAGRWPKALSEVHFSARHAITSTQS